MAQVNKIDSRVVATAYAQETSIGTLPAAPVWRRLRPNSFGDFGSNITVTPREYINESRQRSKGPTTDLEASANFNMDLTFDNQTDLLQGLLFANLRASGKEIVTAVDADTSNPDEYEVDATAGFLVGSIIKGFNFTNAANNAVNVVSAIVTDTSVEVADEQLVAETPPADAYIKVVGHRFAAGDVAVSATSDLPQLVTTLFDCRTLGLNVGQFIYIGGDASGTKFTTAANNGWKRIRSISQFAITLDKSDATMVTEADAGDALTVEIYFGDFLKNEKGTNIVRRTYTIERTLGAPDDASASNIQSDYVEGALFNTYALNIPTADKIAADLTFLAIDGKTRLASQGPLQTGVLNPEFSDAFNTAQFVPRVKLAEVSSTNEAPTNLYAFIQELTLNINNNASLNKAVGVLGAFDITAGTFQVDGSLTAYFNNVTGINAVRNNDDVTFDMILYTKQQAIAYDMPVLSLADGRANVTINEPVTMPLTFDASRGEKISDDFDHTLGISFFPYLPEASIPVA